jgi:RNA polymerase sigma-70 factor (ECF subfamily)
MPDCRPTDEELIREHRQGNAAALAELWVRYDPLVYGLAHGMLRNRHSAEDVRQEVFLRVRERLDQLQDATRFGPWVAAIARNACLSWLRQVKPARSLELLGEDEHPRVSIEAEVELREQRTLLRQLVDGLPEEQRTVIELHYFQEQRKESAGLRLQKMAEVSLATRSLLTALQGAANSPSPSEPQELSAAMALLDSVSAELGHGGKTAESVNAILDQYNRCLGVLQGAMGDPVLQDLFPRLERVTGDTKAMQDRLSELRMAQHALKAYVERLRASGRLARASFGRPEAEEPGTDSASGS